MVICYSILVYCFSNKMIRKRVVQRMRDRVDLIPSCVYDGYALLFSFHEGIQIQFLAVFALRTFKRVILYLFFPANMSFITVVLCHGWVKRVIRVLFARNAHIEARILFALSFILIYRNWEVLIMKKKLREKLVISAFLCSL